MVDFYSGWGSVPNGFAKYRLRLSIQVASQNVLANQTTVNWQMVLEKDRSQNGFYGYASSFSATINGVVVASSGAVHVPGSAWTGWSSWTLASGSLTLNNAADGKLNLVGSAVYNGAHTGWAVGTLSAGGTAPAGTVPAIPRATTATVSPSPAVIGTDVVINLSTAVSGFTHDITWVSGLLSGTIATGVSGNQTWTVPDASGQFPGATVFPITINVTTKSAGVAIGTTQVLLLSRNAPPAPIIAPHDPATQFDVRARLVQYVGGEWAAHQQLPANTLQLVDPASATATCSIGISLLNAVDFSDYQIVDVDVFVGTGWVYTNHRFVLSRTEADDVDPTLTGTYTGTEYVDYLLARAYVEGDYVWDGTPNHAAPTSPGAMLAYGITHAKQRGWGPRIGITFDASKTSLGDPWANTAVSRTFSKGTPLSQMLSSLVDDGLVEYRTEYHDNMAWLVLLNPGTGSDYSAEGAQPEVNLGLAKLASAPRRSTMETRLTSVTVQGDDTLQVTRTAAPFDADVFGVLEGWISASGVKDAASANAIGDNGLRDNAAATSERTFQYAAQDAVPQFYPYSVFLSGDWLLRPDGDNALKDRISQITLNKTADDSLDITVLTGDRILSGTSSLAKRQAAQTGGSINGGNGTSLSPLDSRIPSAPVWESITSEGYWNTDGAAKSAVQLTWAAVTNAVSGATIDVGLYEVWWRPANEGQPFTFKGSTDQTSIVIGDWGVLEEIEFRVRAQSTAGIYGEFSEDQNHTTLAPPVDLDGPLMTDLYTDGVGSIYAVWGGNLEGDDGGGVGGYGLGGYGTGGYGTGGGSAPAPSRLAYVVAEVSSDGGISYTTMGTPIVAAGNIVLNMNGVWGDFMVRLRGYDRLGNPGDASDPQSITLTDPHIDPPTPAAPTDLAATPGAAWDATGFLPEAWFDLSWTAPTLDNDGNPVSIVGYDVLGFRSDETVERVVTSVNNNAARVKVGNGETWTFRVRASSNYGGQSIPSDSITATANATISVAAAPAAPTLDQYAGILRIKWAGGGMVPQTKYVYATVSTTLTGTYTRAGMILNGAGEIAVPGLAPDTDYYAKIVMVDELGQTSVSAAAGPIHLLPITGVTFQTSELANTGIKITTGALTSYDAAGNPTFILNAATGEVWIAPYDAVFDLGASGTVASTGAATTGISISSENSSFNTFIHPSGVEIRNDQTPLSWWEADATDASLVNFFSPRAVIGDRLRVGDYEFLKESKTTGTRLVIRYKGA